MSVLMFREPALAGLQNAACVPDDGAHRAIVVDGELPQVAEPERIARDRLEGALVEVVFVLNPGGSHGGLRKREIDLADHLHGPLQGGSQLIGIARDESVTAQCKVARIVHGGVAVVICAAARCRNRCRGLAARRQGGIVCRDVPRVGSRRVIRIAVVGHPVECVLHYIWHGGAEPDDKYPVTRIGERLGHADRFPAALVLRRLELRARAAAGKGIHPVGNEDHELLAAIFRAVGSLVRIEVKLRFPKGRYDERAAIGILIIDAGVACIRYRACAGSVAVDAAVIGANRPDQFIAAARVIVSGVICNTIVEPHVTEADIQTALIEFVDGTVLVVVEHSE